MYRITIRSFLRSGKSLCNKIPDQIKLKENCNAFNKDLKFFLLKHSFYSADETIPS
jgi:hypothetical protein